MKKSLFGRAFSYILVGFSSIACAVATFAWFAKPNGASETHLDGDIGLRGYFYDGNGSLSHKYEIVRPNHFYNLCRLQNLGIFSAPYYFQVGHDFSNLYIDTVDHNKGTVDTDVDGNGQPDYVDTVDHGHGTVGNACINSNPGGHPFYEYSLDMSSVSSTNTILPIGGEGAPFLGNFDGQGIPIKNLVISGNPEDIGVFGYVSYEGVVNGLVCEDLEVCSLGYSNQPTPPDTAYDYDLFFPNIDDLFADEAHYFVSDTYVTFHKKATSYVGTNLKKMNGASGTSIDDLNKASNLISGTTYYDGYLLPHTPETTAEHPFKYSWKSSSPILKKMKLFDVDNDSVLDDAVVIDLSTLRDSNDFNSKKFMQVDARLSLIASVEIDGFVFSRVIQSYTLEFYSNAHAYTDTDGYYYATIYCDYAAQAGHPATDHNTNYHHGTNIGLLAGHVDGTIKNSFVYNGKIKINDSSYRPINSESQTGLVGEIGTNVMNNIEPDLSLMENGNIGVMNFSRIYSLIRNDFVPTESQTYTVKAGHKNKTGTETYKDYISYSSVKNQNAQTFGLFEKYLRHSNHASNWEYITYTSTTVSGDEWHDMTINENNMKTDYNSVDFLWNRVVEDEKVDGTLVDRGLGVFKVVSSYNEHAEDENSDYGDYIVDNIGDCRIINGKPKTKVYFSTAEKSGGDWSTAPFRATTIPSYCDLGSFTTQFAEDFDYVFELDLADMNLSGGKQYMYNTDSDFLASYLYTKLIDVEGLPINPGNPRFGFMFRSSANEPMSALSSYMPVGKPSNTKYNFKDNQGNNRYYPEKSIVFTISNTKGANISVVGNNADITVYKFDPTKQSGDVSAYATMRSANVSSVDSHRFFTYDVKTGETGTETVKYGATELDANNQPVDSGYAENMADGGALYGHIFQLPAGTYAIGSASGSTDANIYYLAVQGQTDATIGINDLASVGDAAVEFVDFLTEAPTAVKYHNYLFNLQGDKLVPALLSFKGSFNNTLGTIEIDTDTYTGNNKKYLRVRFPTVDPNTGNIVYSSDGSSFIMKVNFYSRNTDRRYWVYDKWVTLADYPYITGS